MKIKKWILVACILFSSIVPVQAKTNKRIMLYSNQLPYVMIASVKDEKHMNVYFIPRVVRLPIACSVDAIASLQQMDMYKDRTCVHETVENFFSLSSKNYVYIHLDKIAKKLDLPLKGKAFSKIGNITDYFAQVVKKLNISMVLNYNTYIDSNLSISDYYDYYKMFKDKKVSIDYSFVNLVYINKEAIPLDNKFHKSST